MNKSLMTLVLVGATSLSTGTFARTLYNTVVDPVTGVVYDTTTAAYNVGRTPFNIFMPHTQRTGYVQGHGYVVTDTNTGMSRTVNAFGHKKHHWVSGVGSCNNGVFPGICNGTNYTITDENTGKTYRVMGVKEGTADVMRGNKVIRYQYVQPIVKHVR